MKKAVLAISVIMTASNSSAEERNCPFSLGDLCFQPAVGAMYAKKTEGEDYRDLRFAAILHKKFITDDLLNREAWGINFMAAPGEKFIDAVGLGVSASAIKIGDSGFAVLNCGGLMKRSENKDGTDDVRGGAYLMLTFSKSN